MWRHKVAAASRPLQRRLEGSATFLGFPDGLNWPLPLHASKVTPAERL